MGERSAAEHASEQGCEQTSEHSGARQQSKQTKGWAGGPVIPSLFKAVLILHWYWIAISFVMETALVVKVYLEDSSCKNKNSL